MGHQPCEGCDKCNTQFGNHTPREPHDLKPQYNRNTGELDHYMCKRCMHLIYIEKVEVSCSWDGLKTTIIYHRGMTVKEIVHTASKLLGTDLIVLQLQHNNDVLNDEDVPEYKEGDTFILVSTGGGV